MAGKIAEVNIAEIAYALKTKKDNNQSMVLFLGSRAGSLYRSQSFYDIMKVYSTRNFKALSRQRQFVECYRLLQQEDRFGDREIHSILMQSLQEKAAVEVNICLAELVKQDLFDIIISTNVDTFLEDAFKEMGMKEQHDFDVINPERDSLYDLVYSDKRLSCSVIKTFGDVAARAYNIVRRDYYLDSVQGLKDLLENILARDVLVIGFDPVWDAEMVRAFTVRDSPLWLATEEDVTIRHPLGSLAKHGRQIKYIGGTIGSSEQFLKALHWHLYEKMPVNYQLVRDTLYHLEAIHRELNELQTIHSEVQAVYQKVLYLQEKFNHWSDSNEGNGV